MRHFTDAAKAQLEQAEKRPECAYELLLDDGRSIRVPDYASLLRTIAQLEDASFSVRVCDGDGAAQRAPRRE